MPTIVYDHQTFALQRHGGISRYFCELAARVHASPDLSSLVLAPLHQNDYLAAAGVPSIGHRIPMQMRGASRVSRAFNDAATALLFPLKRGSLLHQTYYYAAPPRWPRVPVVLTVFDMIHELFAAQFPAQDPTSDCKRRAVQRADHIICISHSTAADLSRLFGVDARKISVTHLGHSAAFGQTASPRPRAGRPYLLYVGHRPGYKNFGRVLRVYLGTRALNDDVDLVTFGGFPFTDEERTAIAAAALREGAVRRIEGDDQALAAAYAGALAFIYPSQYEGFGIPPLEAMSCGCPVACSDTSSLPEVVGDAALLFDPLDDESMRAALLRIVSDQELRDQLVARGRERLALFSWERCAQQTAVAYRQLLAA